MPPRLVYLTQMELPSKSAHPIQIIKTCAALTHYGFQVTLVVEGGGITPEEIRESYGVEPVAERFSVLKAGRDWRTLLRLAEVETLFYTRSQRWARLAIRTRPLHRVPLIFETHRKAGIFKNDPETGIDEPLERRKRIERVFRKAEGVVCAVEATQKRLASQGVRSLYLWYGWTHAGFDAKGSPFSLAYAGTKDLEVVMEAMKLLPEFSLTVYGASQGIRDRFFAANVAFEGFLPHARLLERLRAHGGFIATNEGIKLADYLSLGGPIFAPNLPSVREILGRGGTYYRFKDPSSLARAVRETLLSPEQQAILSRFLAEKRECFAWPRKAEVLKRFLLDFL